VKRLIPLILLLGFLLFFFNLGSRDFWAPDEGDFAQIVRELDGDLLVPHLNQAPYAEKPPLFYYITYSSKKLLSGLDDETSLRLPSALFALLCLLFLALTLQKFFGIGQAYVVTCVLAVSPLFYWQARYLQVDMVFSSFLVGSLLAFFWYQQARNNTYLYLFFFLLALAFTTKGPLAMVLVLPIVIIYLCWRRDFQFFKARETYIGCAIFCAIILPWYVAVYLREGWPFLYENIIQQNFVRFFDAWSHKRPFYYYFTTLPLDFFPWSLFLPMGLLLAFRELRRDSKTGFFLLWFLWMFFFLSLSSGKISKYMLPALPALSLLVSLSITKERSKYNTVVYFVLASLFLVLGMMLLFINVRPDLFAVFFRERVLFASVFLILSAALFYCARGKRLMSSFVVLLSAMVVLFSVGNLLVFSKWNEYKSPRPMVEQMKQFTKGGIPWVYYGSMRGVYVYYMGTPAIAVDEHESEQLRMLGDKLEQFFILTRKRDLPEVQQALGSVTLLIEHRVGDTVMVFVGFQRKT
jgi:4-amino-4-deoxy-L-arabinose transferase-like glycosyltransferase